MPPWLIPAATAGLLAVAGLIVGLALIRSGPGDSLGPEPDPRAQAQMLASDPAEPRLPSGRRALEPTGPEDAPPGTTADAESPPSSDDGPPAATPEPAARAEPPPAPTRPAPAAPTTTPAPTTVSPAPAPGASDDDATIEPVPVAPPAPAARDEPGEDDPIEELSHLAERLQSDGRRLLDDHRASLTAAGRWPPRSDDRIVREELKTLKNAADRLVKACDVVADREGRESAAAQRRAFRRLKAKTLRLTRLSKEDRDTAWQRAEEVLLAGRSTGDLMPRAGVDAATEATWRQLEGHLGQLDRLHARATR